MDEILPAFLVIGEDDEVGGHFLEMLPGLAAELVAGENLNLFRERENRLPHNENYYEQTIPLYSPSSFKEHFRMSPHTMETLIQIVGNAMEPEKRCIYPLDKLVHYTVWMMAKPETFLAGGDRFNLPKATSHKLFHEIVGIIASKINDYIQWPNALQQRSSTEKFHELSQGFPGIIGAIDGCHIEIRQPENNAVDYYNRKQFHSVILQAVCDENCKFINVATGYPGRMHDARVLRISECGQHLDRNDLHLIENEAEHHLIADAAYPLTKNMLTPYRDNGHLSARQVNYNRKLSSVRSTIERAFGRLKGKFRRINFLEFTNLNYINQFIMASCVLHNLILQLEGADDEEDRVPVDEDGEDEYNGPAFDGANAGAIKRQYITGILPM